MPGSTIEFAIKDPRTGKVIGKTQTIKLQKSLPTIREKVTIDGAALPKNPAQEIVLNGLGEALIGLKFVLASDSQVKGLTITNFKDYGIDSSHSSITIGGPATNADQSTKNRVYITNNDTGIEISADNNLIIDTYIGTRDGVNPQPNRGDGILIFGNQNWIGSKDGTLNQFERNVISGNTKNGILIFSGSNNRIVNNYIGTTASGQNALGNGANGILINGLPGKQGNQIGGKAVVEWDKELKQFVIITPANVILISSQVPLE